MRRWRYSVDVLRFLRENSLLHLCVKFEDLIIQPETCIQQICEFLSIPFSEEMLQGISNKRLRPEYQREGLDQSTLKIEGTPRSWEEAMQEDLRYCGYLS